VYPPGAQGKRKKVDVGDYINNVNNAEFPLSVIIFPLKIRAWEAGGNRLEKSGGQVPLMKLFQFNKRGETP